MLRYTQTAINNSTLKLDATCANTTAKNVSVTTWCQCCSPESIFPPYPSHRNHLRSRSHQWAFALCRRSGFTHRAHLLPPPRRISTPATTGVGSAPSAMYGTVECFIQDVNPAARRVLSAPSPSHVAHSPHRAGVVSFPDRQDESIFAVGVISTACGSGLGSWHGVERTTLTTLSRRTCSLRRFPCTTIVYQCLVCCLPPAN